MVALEAEWLETDGRGGFASGTVGGIRTRRYHALLLTSTKPPTGRMVLVNGLEAWIDQPSGRTPLTSQRYLPDVIYPDAAGQIRDFTNNPWPVWTFSLLDDTHIRYEVLVDPISGDTVLRWRCPITDARLSVRPLLSTRDYHSLQRENHGFDFTPKIDGGNVAWRPYASQPAFACLTNGHYEHDPTWYSGFLYTAERERGLDYVEDLASPGVFTWTFDAGDAVMALRVGDGLSVRPALHVARVFEAEASRRGRANDAVSRGAETYLVDRGRGSSLIAGYPWFTDWGRDTFIALRGLLLGTGRVRQAEAVLLAWSELVSEGMLPNRFSDGAAVEYNAADASLWFVVAVHDLLTEPSVSMITRARLRAAVDAILDGHARGTRYGIAMDTDGLLRAGVAGQQLTWMDVKIGDWTVTPRIGKPVEIQALWYNALRIASAWNPNWLKIAEQARASFRSRFTHPDSGGLFDVVDAEHRPGAVDASVRPNQIFAVGGLPFALLDHEAARSVVQIVEQTLLTPLGLRTLAPSDPRYKPRYQGSPVERDAAYHQGTVWPWLIGPFVEAWLRVEGDNRANRITARDRFLGSLFEHLETTGLGHVSELADGDPPHTPGGCPFQAWSLGELIRARNLTERGAA